MIVVYCILFFWLLKMISPKVKDEWNIPMKKSNFQMIRKIYNMQVRVCVCHNSKVVRCSSSTDLNSSPILSSTCQKGTINYDDKGQNVT